MDDNKKEKDDNEEYNDWGSHFLEKVAIHGRSILTIDSDLRNILTTTSRLQLPWFDLLDYLKMYYAETSREIIGPNKKIRHLGLFNSKNSDYLILFKCSELSSTELEHSTSKQQLHDSMIQENLDFSSLRLTQKLKTPLLGQIMNPSYSVEVYTVSREGHPSDLEYEHIAEVVSSISYWLYSRVVKS